MSALDPGAAVRDVLARWNAASTPWDAAALAAVYAPQAVFFGGRPGHCVGRERIRDYFASYDGIVASGSMVLADEVVVALAPECVLVQGFVDFAFELSGGERTRSVLRATLVVARRDDRWLIVQHHFSPTPAQPPLRTHEDPR